MAELWRERLGTRLGSLSLPELRPQIQRSLSCERGPQGPWRLLVPEPRCRGVSGWEVPCGCKGRRVKQGQSPPEPREGQTWGRRPKNHSNDGGNDDPLDSSQAAPAGLPRPVSPTALGAEPYPTGSGLTPRVRVRAHPTGAGLTDTGWETCQTREKPSPHPVGRTVAHREGPRDESNRWQTPQQLPGGK